MNILICSDSFKDSLASIEVSSIISDILLRKFPKAKICAESMADGGEGTLDALQCGTRGKLVNHFAVDSLLRKTKADLIYYQNEKHAVIELAQTCGLSMLKSSERNCSSTSTYGVGLQILEAMRYNVNSIDLMIGGSATNDLGIGMAAALSYKFYMGSKLVEYPTGKDMEIITKIDFSSALTNDIKFKVVTDVNNTLLGSAGAT